MKSKYSEKTILNIIKYSSLIPIILFSIFITYFLVKQKDNELKYEINNLKSRFLLENKQNVKKEVLRVIDSINYEIKISNESLKSFIKDKVYEAHNIATNLYQKQVAQGVEKDKIFQTIKLALEGMIYNKGEGYIFIDDINGVKILQPLNKSYEGKNLLDYEDIKGHKLIEKIVETIKNKTEAYDTYYWYKPKDNKTAYKKMSFYKYFEPFELAIGTGEYLIDFQKRIQQNLLKRIRSIRFDENGYIFIFDSKGTYLSYFKKEKINTNIFENTSKDIKELVKRLLKFTKKEKKGFVSYLAPAKPNSPIGDRKKISYIKYFEEWDWIIGAGFYLDEIDKEIKKKELVLIKKYENIISNIMFLSLMITTILLLMSFYISKLVSKKFDTYKNSLKEEMNKTIEKERLLTQQSKMATMGEMIGNIAHQWKQPLSTISTASTGIKLQKELETLNDTELIRSMDMINNSAQYLAQTIEDFRSFFRPHKLKQKFSFSNTYDKALKLIDSQFKNNNIELIEKIQDTTLNTYQNELLQVLINILKNSKDELIKIEKEKRRLIFINAFSKNNNLYVRIKDNAGGIKEELLDKIFEAYFTTKKDEEGTGLGLYMSKQIIENMSGELKVTNLKYSYEEEEYSGAQFTLIIPLN